MKFPELNYVDLAIYSFCLIFIAGYSIYYSRYVTATHVPMQWGLDGNPTWFAPRLVGLWWGGALTLMIGLPMVAIGLFSNSTNGLWFNIMLFPAIMCSIHFWYIRTIARYTN